MTTFITLFVATQLLLGFCALLTAMRQPQFNSDDNARLQPVRIRRE